MFKGQVPYIYNSPKNNSDVVLLHSMENKTQIPMNDNVWTLTVCDIDRCNPVIRISKFMDANITYLLPQYIPLVQI